MESGRNIRLSSSQDIVPKLASDNTTITKRGQCRSSLNQDTVTTKCSQEHILECVYITQLYHVEN